SISFTRQLRELFVQSASQKFIERGFDTRIVVGNCSAIYRLIMASYFVCAASCVILGFLDSWISL
ncbi:MAG: hypothetical protein NC416_19135, partial [Eubacterium sp.]|nr:hypothetical protein [Eubacterium sp.]